MKLFFPRENNPTETRISILPQTVEKLKKLGAEVAVEKGIGTTLGLGDALFAEAGATMADQSGGLADADLILRLGKPTSEQVAAMPLGVIHISFLDPFNSPDLVQELAGRKISAISLEMLPRTTLAQKMDALSSQANLGGYVAVIMAAERINRIFPMMTTPAGTIAPTRVFVIGVGVAGLQAIATARRLGAVVEAFDTRPVVEEQVKSLGARFVKIDLGETGETKQGYAKQLSQEQLERQRQSMAKHCAAANVVITTAQIFGRKAPVIVTGEMIAGMSPGSVVVDMATDSGGNVEGSKKDEEIEVHGVRILGFSNLPGRVPLHASQMLASNLYNIIEHFWDREAAAFKLELDNEIIQGSLITHGGKIVNAAITEQQGADPPANPTPPSPTTQGGTS